MTPVLILHVWYNLLHNSPYGAVVCGSNINILTIAELFLISHSAPTFPRKEGQEVDGRDKEGTADLNWPRGYPEPCSIKHSSESGGRGRKGERGAFQVCGCSEDT